MNTNQIDLDTFVELYDDDLYIMYMESGAYYDQDREEFDEMHYEEYCARQGRWSNVS